MSNCFFYELARNSLDEIQALHGNLAVGILSNTIMESWQSSELNNPVWLLLVELQTFNSVRRQNRQKARKGMRIMTLGRMIQQQACVEQSISSKTNSRKVRA